MKDRPSQNVSKNTDDLPKLRPRAKLNEKHNDGGILKKTTLSESRMEVATKHKVTFKSHHSDGKRRELKKNDFKPLLPNDTSELVVMVTDKRDGARKREHSHAETEQSLVTKKLKYNHYGDQFKACFRLQHSHLPYSDVPDEDIAGIYKIAYKWQTIFIGETPTSIRNRLNEHMTGTDCMEIGQFLSGLQVRDKQMNVTVYWLDKNTTSHSCPENNFLLCIEIIEGKKPKYNQSLISASTPIQNKSQDVIPKQLIHKAKETLNISYKCFLSESKHGSQNGTIQSIDKCTNDQETKTKGAHKKERKKSYIPVLKANYVDGCQFGMYTAKNISSVVSKDMPAHSNDEILKNPSDIHNNENIWKNTTPLDHTQQTHKQYDNNFCERNSTSPLIQKVHFIYHPSCSSYHNDNYSKRLTNNCNHDSIQRTIADKDKVISDKPSIVSKRTQTKDNRKYHSVIDKHGGSDMYVPRWNMSYSNGTTSANHCNGRSVTEGDTSSYWTLRNNHMQQGLDVPEPPRLCSPTSVKKQLVFNNKACNIHTNDLDESNSVIDRERSNGTTTSESRAGFFWIPKNDFAEDSSLFNHISADKQLVMNNDTQAKNFVGSDTSNIETGGQARNHSIGNTPTKLASCNSMSHPIMSLQAQIFRIPKTPSQYPSQGISHTSQSPSQGATHTSQSPSQETSQSSQSPSQGTSHASQSPSQGTSHASESPSQGTSHASQSPSHGASHASQSPSQGTSHASQSPYQGTSYASQGTSHASQGTSHASQGTSHASQSPSLGTSHASQGTSHASQSPSRGISHVSKSRGSPSLLQRPKDRNIWQSSQRWFQQDRSLGIISDSKERHFSDALVHDGDSQIKKTPSGEYSTDLQTCKSRLLGTMLFGPHNPPLPRAVIPRRCRNRKFAV